MQSNTLPAENPADTADAQNETLFAKRDGAMVPVGQLVHRPATDGGHDDHDAPREFRGTGFEGENPRTLATDGGAQMSLAEAEPERPAIDEPPRCSRCGEHEYLDRPLAEADWCVEFESVCSDCLIEHGPLDCEHETPSGSDWAAMESR